MTEIEALLHGAIKWRLIANNTQRDMQHGQAVDTANKVVGINVCECALCVYYPGACRTCPLRRIYNACCVEMDNPFYSYDANDREHTQEYALMLADTIEALLLEKLYGKEEVMLESSGRVAVTKNTVTIRTFTITLSEEEARDLHNLLGLSWVLFGLYTDLDYVLKQ